MARIVLLTISLLLVVTACEQSTSKFKGLSDTELRRQRSVCRSIKHPSPGKAIACENIEKEYQRRLKAKRGG